MLLLTVVSIAQDYSGFETGKIIDKVSARADSAQSYSLYLPKNYTPEKKWAILYGFDPMARGRVPVEIFLSAAEKYGVIVVGSNISQNGLDGNSLVNIFQTLWKDTHDRFSVDKDRVYAAGFSVGARTASLLAAACQTCITGVIGGGAGFSNQIKPDAKMPFIYFGIIGADDFNYPEVCALDQSLTGAKTPHRIETFTGGHEWFPKETAEHALRWMQLQTMKSGKREKDEKFIEEIFRFHADEAKSLLAANQFFEAYQSHIRLIEDFTGLRDVSEFVAAVEKLKNSKELKKAAQAEEEQITRQKENEKQFFALGANLLNTEEKAVSRQEMKRFIGNLTKKSEQTENNSDRRIARRSLAGFFIAGFEAAVFNYKPKKQFAAAAVNLETALEINPQAARAWFELAKIYALDGRRKKAIDALEAAVKTGLKDASLLENSADFDSVRQNEGFKKILSNLNNAQSN